MRNHFKDGNSAVLKMFGYTNPKVNVTEVSVFPKSISFGEKVKLRFDLASKSNSEQKLMIDLKVHYVKANGSTKGKVFKFKDIVLESKESISLEKKLDFTPRNTRKLYPGKHKVQVQINGEPFGHAIFELNT